MIYVITSRRLPTKVSQESLRVIVSSHHDRKEANVNSHPIALSLCPTKLVRKCQEKVLKSIELPDARSASFCLFGRVASAGEHVLTKLPSEVIVTVEVNWAKVFSLLELEYQPW